MSTLSLRLPNSLHERARELAEREGISINQLIATALAEKRSALMTEEYLEVRARRGEEIVRRLGFNEQVSRAVAWQTDHVAQDDARRPTRSAPFPVPLLVEYLSVAGPDDVANRADKDRHACDLPRE